MCWKKIARKTYASFLRVRGLNCFRELPGTESIVFIVNVNSREVNYVHLFLKSKFWLNGKNAYQVKVAVTRASLLYLVG